MPLPPVHVCMIAYTDYAYDARVRREAETLAANGFRVRCLCLANGRDRDPFMLDGVEVRPMPVRKYRGKSTLAYVSSYLRFTMWSSAACLQLLLRKELDIVHAHNIPDFIVAAGVLPRLAGCRIVLDIHDSVPETFATKFSNTSALQRLLEVEERLSTWLAHKVICVNHPQRDTLVARGLVASKTFVSMNVPDPRIFTNASKAAGAAEDTEPVKLVYHGTMAKRLGVDLLIRAVAQLRANRHEVLLHLWGHGDDLREFQALVRDLNVEDAVLFEPKGFPLRDLPQHLSGMDLGVIGNRRSAAGDLMLPVKLLEYISLGIPAVVPRLKAIEHYFSDDMLTYYAPDDVNSLTEAVGRMCRDRQGRASQAQRARTFLTRHGWDRQGPEFVSFYNSMARN